MLNSVLHHKMLNVQLPNQAGAAAIRAGERVELADSAGELFLNFMCALTQPDYVKSKI